MSIKFHTKGALARAHTPARARQFHLLTVNQTAVKTYQVLRAMSRQVPLFTSSGLGLGLENLVLFTLLYCMQLFTF